MPAAAFHCKCRQDELVCCWCMPGYVTAFRQSAFVLDTTTTAPWLCSPELPLPLHNISHISTYPCYQQTACCVSVRLPYVHVRVCNMVALCIYKQACKCTHLINRKCTSTDCCTVDPLCNWVRHAHGHCCIRCMPLECRCCCCCL